MNMNFRTYILIGLLAFFGAGLLLTSDVQAAADTCKLSVGPPGTCKNNCDGTEIADGALSVIPGVPFGTAVGCTNQICCLPKGTLLCQPVGQALITIEVEKICGAGKSPSGVTLPTYSCQSECEGSTLAAELCLGGTKCCKSGTLDKAVVEAACKKASSGTQTAAPVKTITLENPLGPGATLYTVIQRVIKAFLGIVGALALLVFIYSGVLWMTAEASERIQKAKDTMKYAVIGLAMIAFAYAISTFAIDVLTGKYAKQSQPQDVEYAQQNEFENN